MKADTWMPFYIADYLRKTMHLSREQHGAYLLLLMACWDRGGKLPNDPGYLAGTVKASPAEWRKLAPVMLAFFQVEGDSLVNSRVVDEHAKAARLSEARREAGAKGGRPRKDDESNEKPIGFANEKQNETPALVAQPSPLTSPLEKGLEASLPAATVVATEVATPKPKSAKPRAAVPAWLTDPDFCAAWDACTAKMRKRSESREKTYAHWKRQVLLAGSGANLLHALRGYLRGDDDVNRTGGPGFHVWLSEGRWDHWTTTGSGGVSAIRPVWVGPPEIRNAVVRETSSDFAGSYLDPCAWTGEAIQPRNSYAADKLRRLRALQNVTILEPQGVAA